jgi:hypothetical protein
MRKKLSAILIVLTLFLMLGAPAIGATGILAAPEQSQAGPRPIVQYATRTDTSASLRQMPQLPPAPKVLGEIFERPRHLLPNRQGSTGPSGPDPALQGPTSGSSAPTTGANFEGVNNVNGVLPPDTNGDVGPNHYVQMVNLSFAIWDRAGNLLYGPVNSNTLWQGFGGPCETTNDGDPIVLYDHLADRWMMSQFALPNFPRGPFYQCVAVSQTGDPTGAWHRYEFTISSDKLNDYPKFGVWPDGYYMAINQFKCNVARCSWAGQGVVVFERDQMLLGQQARMVYFDLYSLDPNLGGMLPSDLDGPTPPSGAPNYFSQMDDDAWGYSPDQLQVWEFHVDWASPTNSTFTRVAQLGTAVFDSNMCGYSRNCIPQPGGTNVDAISDRLMYRLQYRNFGGHQTLVVNHTVDVNGADRAGVRWYELRNTGSGWSIYQQGTYSPDSHHRWMASVAMNSAGDIALGFSVSSTSVYPSIRATGRLAGDALGQMTQGEVEIRTGSGYQQHSSGRWGDYSMLAVDPVDDCTFWYTQEYYQVVGNAPWQTRIGSFKLRECGPVDNPPSVTITNPADGSTVSGAITVSADASDDNGVTQVEFFVDGASLGVDTTAPYSVSWDTTTVSDGSHTVSAVATDTAAQTGSDTNTVTVDNVTEPSTTAHVGDLDGASVNNGSSWTANVTITVHDNNHNPVSNATVSGTWSNGASGTASCTTNSSGQCAVSKSSIPKRTGSVRFTVDSVTHSTLTYNSADNHDPDGSNGTSITVNKP